MSSTYMDTSPTGWSTGAFKAYYKETGNVVFLKDTWRIIDDDPIPDHETYIKLAKEKVKFVATSPAYHDIQDRETRTLDFKSEGRREFHRFQLYRLVLDQYARSIQQFENVRELIQVWRDTLQG
ncbi:hypothetical protein CVT25_000351 [Psilocybe cyanescens]|uniref:Fungal-type protein kinase domain-containing protein n=1 Tax=Psilocybe cyanescens TaxID=93625 RepID=A0A409VNZ2_PSICY|nr:hypothetical protein CVT25_000351 [Psilocybe cyanescens]